MRAFRNKDTLLSILQGTLAVLVLTLVFASLSEAKAPLLDKEGVLKRFMEKGAVEKCEEFVEWEANYQHRWLDDKRYPRWDGPEAVVFEGKVYYFFYGWNIQFQNGFGAWSRQKYVCGLDPLLTEVLEVLVEGT